MRAEDFFLCGQILPFTVEDAGANKTCERRFGIQSELPPLFHIANGVARRGRIMRVKSTRAISYSYRLLA
jgi:hypothetical protein